MYFCLRASGALVQEMCYFSMPSVTSICLLARVCTTICMLGYTLLTQYRTVTQFFCGRVNYLSLIGLESSGGFLK